ncbi:DUF4440 domain-containing protein [Longibacter salinarum]|uniref:DUF4440 domain-containing protein n=1 Tax=Longibacter salinarum TaxID=1850348 RepID=A0A2A8D0V5_9BACT|nr:SgcJ/EcaC family oxidoreductase [Longibacter salinarum]PEN14278.1 DUF4440 domain-containing protein [Longibacter salinarum]
MTVPRDDSHPKIGYGPANEPGRIAELWVEAWNRHDADEIAGLFADDAEFVNVTGLWWHSREDIRRAHAYGFDRIFGDSTITLLETSTRWLCGDEAAEGHAVALIHARMKLRGQTATGDTESPGIRRNLFSFVVRRTGARWMCVSAHNTDIVPGSETNVVDSDGRLQSVSYR